MMKGYKGMRADMTCRGKQYRVGGTYHEDDVALCEKGLHFCEHLSDVFHYYGFGNGYDGSSRNRFFEVEAAGMIYLGRDKGVASDLTIIRELTDVEISRGYYGNGEGSGGFGYRFGDGHNYDTFGHGVGFGCNLNHGDGADCTLYGDGSGFGCTYDRFGDGEGGGDGHNGYGRNIQKILMFKEI